MDLFGELIARGNSPDQIRARHARRAARKEVIYDNIGEAVGRTRVFEAAVQWAIERQNADGAAGRAIGSQHPGVAAHHAVLSAIGEYELPQRYNIRFAGMKRLGGSGQHRLETGIVTMELAFTGISGHKSSMDIPVIVKEGRMYEPVVLIHQGNIRAITQHTFDDILKRGELTVKVPDRAHMYAQPTAERRPQREVPLIRPGMFGYAPQNRSLHASRRAQVGSQSQFPPLGGPQGPMKGPTMGTPRGTPVRLPPSEVQQMNPAQRQPYFDSIAVPPSREWAPWKNVEQAEEMLESGRQTPPGGSEDCPACAGFNAPGQHMSTCPVWNEQRQANAGIDAYLQQLHRDGRPLVEAINEALNYAGGTDPNQVVEMAKQIWSGDATRPGVQPPAGAYYDPSRGRTDVERQGSVKAHQRDVIRSAMQGQYVTGMYAMDETAAIRLAAPDDQLSPESNKFVHLSPEVGWAPAPPLVDEPWEPGFDEPGAYKPWDEAEPEPEPEPSMWQKLKTQIKGGMYSMDEAPDHLDWGERPVAPLAAGDACATTEAINIAGRDGYRCHLASGSKGQVIRDCHAGERFVVFFEDLGHQVVVPGDKLK